MDILPTDLTDDRIREHLIPQRLINFDGHDEADAPRGLYLQLLHGRTDPDQDMDDWGSNCEDDIGPFDWAHFTYNNTTTLGYGKRSQSNSGEVWMLDNFSAEACFLMPPNSLCRHDDMLFWNGVFYGDWEFIFR